VGLTSGWLKHPASPVLGGDLGTCFDVCLLKEDGFYRMWFSWRPRQSLALVESPDGIHWSAPQIVLGPTDTGWEDDLNRPVVMRREGRYHLWYTGQTQGRSSIGYATSPDGVDWHRQSREPVLTADQPWEQVAVMCPHVLFEERTGRYRMWYSGGEQYEPDALGHAAGADGLHWDKDPANPVFAKCADHPWEQHKVTACQVIAHEGWHLMFYLGFEDVHTARIGLARSRDGLTGWERHPANPILSPTPGAWDTDACYKPFALCEGDRWRLWYNGRRGHVEQIGMAVHEGPNLFQET